MAVEARCDEIDSEREGGGDENRVFGEEFYRGLAK